MLRKYWGNIKNHRETSRKYSTLTQSTCVNGHWRVSAIFSGFFSKKGKVGNLLLIFWGNDTDSAAGAWRKNMKYQLTWEGGCESYRQQAFPGRQAGSKHASCEIPDTSKSCLLSTDTDGMGNKELSRLRVGFTGTQCLCRSHSCLTKWGKSCLYSAQSRVHLDRNKLHATDNGLLLHSLDLHSSPAHVTPATAKSVWINFSSVASWDNASDVLIKLRQAAAIIGFHALIKAFYY